MKCPKTQGARWLKLLGYEHLTGQFTGFEIDGKSVPVEQFDLLCGEHVAPTFAALEHMGPSHPKYELFLGVARSAFQAHFGPVEIAP